jgi:phage-related protein
MAYKSRRHRTKKHNVGFFKSVKNNTSKIIPGVQSGIQKVGSTVQNVATGTVPLVKKGFSQVYGTLATGFDMGMNGIKNGVNTVKKVVIIQKNTPKRRGSKKSRKSRKNKSRRNY